MKKITLIIGLISFSIVANAQSFKIGAVGAFNSTWLFNKTVSDAGDVLDYKSTFGGQGGVGARFGFEGGVGISLDVLYNSVNQTYKNKDTLFGTYETESMVHYLSLPLLFRYTGESGVYAEIGPEFSLLLGSDFSFNGVSGSAKDITNTSNIAAVIGFGADIKATKLVDITAGLRFAWGLSDVYKTNPYEYRSSTHETTNTGVGGIHVGVFYKLQ